MTVSTETFIFLPIQGCFCRNRADLAEIKLFLHFCRYSFLKNKLFLPNMQNILFRPNILLHIRQKQFILQNTVSAEMQKQLHFGRNMTISAETAIFRQK